MSDVDPGRMDRKIVIQKQIASSNEFGAKREWITHQNVWAEYSPGGGGEVFEAYGHHAKKSAKFKIHYMETLRDEMRIRFEGQDWKILGFREIGYRAGMEIDAEVIL